MIIFTCKKKQLFVQYKQGDRVSFLNQPGGGVVKNLLSKFRLIVTSDDGFDIAVSVDEIVPICAPSVYTISSKHIDEKEKHNIKQKLSKRKKEEEWEVDLHLDEIIGNSCFMNDHQKLQHQIRYFKNCMDRAVDCKIKKVIFIHGVGKGRLKQEIINVLKEYERIKYYDAPFRKYGVGALVVEFC